MLSIANISKTLGGDSLFENVTFTLNPGEKVGLVGPNGAGKSTLFKIIVKEVLPDSGEVSFPSKRKMAYFSQNVGELKGETALNIVMAGDEELAKLKRILGDLEKELSEEGLCPDKMEGLLEHLGETQTLFEKRGGYEAEARAEEILTGLGIPPQIHHNLIETFSGGMKMRVALARTLVTSPHLIIMDEPTNYLDMETILWLEQWLKNYDGAIFMTTHDRHFMNNVVGRIIEIAHGKVISYTGNYDFYEKERELRRGQLEAQAQRQQDMLAKEETFIAKFKARASHAAQVQSRVKKLEKIQRIEVPPEEEQIHFAFPTPPRGGDNVAVIKNLSKSFPIREGQAELKIVFEGLETIIRRLQKIAVVGVNGAGKSTLLKVIVGKLTPTSGTVEIGQSIKMGYFGQYAIESLRLEASVLEEAQEALPEASPGQLRNLLAAFLFRGSDVEKRVKVLSGGEKSRLVLAILLAQKKNFLVLDEPTNHLDMASRNVLLKALKDFEGTVLFVSHDRHFLHELSEGVMELDKGKITYFPGKLCVLLRVSWPKIEALSF